MLPAEDAEPLCTTLPRRNPDAPASRPATSRLAVPTTTEATKRRTLTRTVRGAGPLTVHDHATRSHLASSNRCVCGIATPAERDQTQNMRVAQRVAELVIATACDGDHLLAMQRESHRRRIAPRAGVEVPELVARLRVERIEATVAFTSEYEPSGGG